MKARLWTAVMLCACAVPAIGQSGPTAPTMLDLVSDPLVAEAVHARVARHPINLAADGCSAASREWLDGKRKSWVIEFQRGGGSLILAGVVRHDHKLVDQGLRLFEWGFTRQDPATGGFPESADAFHSTSVFLVEVCRALLAMEDNSTEFQAEMPRVKAMIPHVRAAAHWFLRPQVLEPGKQKDQPFTHRKWLLAFSLGGAAKLSGDRELTAAAAAFANEGIALQQEDGRNPEKGGYDVSYQMVDALVGSYYYTTLAGTDSAELRPQVQRMIERTCQWEMRRILPTGEIDVTGSTRMQKERMHNGELKQINYPEVLQAFAHAARISGNPQYADAARRIARGQGWIAPGETGPSSAK